MVLTGFDSSITIMKEALNGVPSARNAATHVVAWSVCLTTSYEVWVLPRTLRTYVDY